MVVQKHFGAKMHQIMKTFVNITNILSYRCSPGIFNTFFFVLLVE